MNALLFLLLLIEILKLGASRVQNTKIFKWFDGNEISFNSSFWCETASINDTQKNCLEYVSPMKCVHNYKCEIDNVNAFCEKEMHAENNAERKKFPNLFLFLQIYIIALILRN